MHNFFWQNVKLGLKVSRLLARRFKCIFSNFLHASIPIIVVFSHQIPIFKFYLYKCSSSGTGIGCF